MKTSSNFDIEKSLNYSLIAGCDEVGRGPLCGPVIAAAVVFLKYDFDDMPFITDSKKMTNIQRETSYKWLTNNDYVLWAIGSCSPKEIDEINILQASLLAMTRAVNNLSKKPDFCLIDGNKMPKNIIGRSIVHGDIKSLSIASASVIAKQTRDELMKNLAKQFPQYNWAKNVGYPTKEHLQAIEKYGINEHYRKTFRPVKERILKNGNE